MALTMLLRKCLLLVTLVVKPSLRMGILDEHVSWYLSSVTGATLNEDLTATLL